MLSVFQRHVQLQLLITAVVLLVVHSTYSIMLAAVTDVCISAVLDVGVASATVAGQGAYCQHSAELTETCSIIVARIKGMPCAVELP